MVLGVADPIFMKTVTQTGNIKHVNTIRKRSQQTHHKQHQKARESPNACNIESCIVCHNTATHAPIDVVTTCSH